MPSKPLPKPVSERTLQRKYKELAVFTHGRLDISTDSGKRLSDQMHRYFSAFSNLYGVIPLHLIWEFFCEVEPAWTKQKNLLQKDFLAFSDIVRVEAQPYYLLNLDEISLDESDSKPLHRLLVNKKLIGQGYYRFFDLFTLLESQSGKSYVLLPKESYLTWAEPDAFRRSPYAQDMLRFLKTLRVSDDSSNRDVDGCLIRGKTLDRFIFWNSNETHEYECASRKWEKDFIAAKNNLVESEKLMQMLERNIQLGDPILSQAHFLQMFLSDLKKVGVSLSDRQLDRLLKLHVDLNNKSRLWCNCGWTPEELSQMK